VYVQGGDQSTAGDGNLSPSVRLRAAIPSEAPMRRIGLVVVHALDCYRNGDDGIYRSVYPDDGMSTDAA
jgi:hypothetical protein